MEQELRQLAIKRYHDNEKLKSIYTDLNCSKYWFFKWLKRYQSGDSDWYKDQSKAPHRQPTALSQLTSNGSSLSNNVLSIKNLLKLVPQRSNGS